MKHLRLFESFQEQKTKITIDFGGDNPDADWDATVVGIAKDPTAAALYAAVAFIRVPYSNEKSWIVSSIEDAKKEALENWFNDQDYLNKILERLKKKKIDRADFDCDYAQVTVEKIQTDSPDMGIIIGFTVNDVDKFPSDFNPEFQKI